MFARVAIAVAGALVVTGALLLTMDSLISLFENERGERYFRIHDVLQKPEPGRPERPRAQRRPPDQPEAPITSPDSAVPIETPDEIDLPSPAIELPELPGN
jgi:hypothetical protein